MLTTQLNLSLIRLTLLNYAPLKTNQQVQIKGKNQQVQIKEKNQQVQIKVLVKTMHDWSRKITISQKINF